MRNLKTSFLGLLLVFSAPATADGGDVPDTSTWYFHVDFEQMRTAEAGRSLYTWAVDEVFWDINEEAGVDLAKELDKLTAYSLPGQGPVFLFEGNISQTSRDRLMAFVAAEGDLAPLKSSGRSYYRLSDGSGSDGNGDAGNIELQFDSLQNESWVSMALDNKVLVTATEGQMQALLKNNGRIAGKRSHKGALLVLTAEKALLQAGVNSGELGGGDDSEPGWESNILRNTEQVAFLVAAAANKLAIEATLVTTEAEMAESLASVVRGLISLTAFSDDLDAEAVAMLQGTRIETKGKNLSISLAIDPDVLVATLSE